MKKSDGSLTEESSALVETVEYYLLLECDTPNSQHTMEESVRKMQGMKSLVVERKGPKGKAGDRLMGILL